MQGVVTRYLQVIYYIIVKPNFTMMLWYLKWSLNSTFFGTFQLFQSEFCRKQTASYPVSPVPPRIPCWGRDKCGNSKKKEKEKKVFLQHSKKYFGLCCFVRGLVYLFYSYRQPAYRLATRPEWICLPFSF